MTALRRTLALFVLCALGISTAYAASVATAPGSLGAARVATPRCTTAGLSVLQNLSGSTVVSVTVGNLPAACGNGTIQVAVNNGSVSATGSGTVPAAGGSITVTLGAAPAVAAGEETDVVVTGP